MLRLILGPAGSGKTAAIVGEIARAVEEGRGGQLLLVPEQYSHEAEKELCRVCGASLSLYAEVFSFTGLARRILAKEGGAALPCLDPGGRLLCMMLALESVSARLKVYGPARRRPELQEQLQQQGVDWLLPAVPDPYIMVESQIIPDVPQPEFRGRDGEQDGENARKRAFAVKYICEVNRIEDMNTSNERRLRKYGDAFWKAYWDEEMCCGDRRGDIRIKDADLEPFAGGGSRKHRGHETLADASFAAGDGYYLLDARSGVELCRKIEFLLAVCAILSATGTIVCATFFCHDVIFSCGCILYHIGFT